MVVLPIELAHHPFFATLPSDDVVAAASLVERRVFRPGACLFECGATCSDLILVLHGLVQLSRPQRNGTTITIGIARAGAVLAAAALSDHQRHHARAEALGRVDVIEIPLANVAELSERCPHMFMKVLQALATRISTAQAISAVTMRGGWRIASSICFIGWPGLRRH